jgi:uncharacterized protein YndB with AHSA1/START domain
MNTANTNDAIIREITINAPAQRVFDALTDPQKRVQWWASQGRFTATHMKSDLRPGGQWIMRGTRGDGQPFSVRGEYRAVDPPRLLEFTWIADWHENEPATTVRFELNDNAGVTTVRLTHSGFTNEKSREGYQGWPLLLKMLQGYVEQRK